ncbi:unnamed protein product [Peniophora sp. CBMAI 1063]|nr:unnamed protein product [Peniophora sp. CBMAI 1063]
MDWLPLFAKQRPSRPRYYELLPSASPKALLRCRIVTFLICCALLAFLLFSTSLGAHMPAKYTSIDQATYETCTVDESVVSGGYLRPHTGEYVAPHEDEWTWERVRTMVEETSGFYVRDWPLQLGWNNMRYIIEAGLLHASLLNRTLVIPSFVYARSCLYDFDVCSVFAQKFHRGDEIGMGDFKYLSDAEQIAWRLPISLMLDLPRIRRAHSVITVSEYLRLQELNPKLELGNGSWSATLYHEGPQKPTLRSLTTSDWDEGFVRVDREYDLPKPKDVGGAIDVALRGQLHEHGTIEIGHAQNVMHDQAHAQWESIAELEQLLHNAGWGVLHTFRGSFVEMFKAVTDWETEVAPLESMRGLVDGLGMEPANVVHVQGETHWNRKAGQLRFTTGEARTQFAGLVLHGVHPIPAVRALGECFSKRMLDLNNGRQYLAAHMRRGDFSVLKYAAERTIQDHTARIKDRLHNGLTSLREWAHSGWRPVDVPGIALDNFGKNAQPPLENDAFFLATDTTDVMELEYVHREGAILLADLMQAEDERLLGWPALFGDVRAQVEQEVAAHAAFFYGHSMSSVAGGIANLRGARGKDPRTCYVD